MTENLTRSTFSGLKWTYGATAASVLLQVGYTAVMGRLLTPADFGLVAMALVFLRFGNHFAQMGLGPALIQKESLSDRDVRIGFTSSLLLGTGFAAVLVLVAPLAEQLFADPDVVPVTRALALSFVLNGAGLTALSLLRRRLRFRALAMVNVASYAAGYLVVGVTLALMGAGVWSLVGAALVQTLLEALFAYTAVRHSVRPLFAVREARALFGFGSRVSVIGFLEFLASNLDVLVIGRVAGQTALGQYNRASLLVNLPLQHLGTGLSRVLFPAFSRIQAETKRLRRGYLGAMQLSSALILPLTAGMAVAAPELVRVVLGPQWSPAARVLPLLALAAALGFLTHYAGVTCEAVAALNQKLALQAISLVLLAALLFIAAEGGLVALAGAVAASQLVRHTLYAVLMTRILHLRAVDHWLVYGRSLLSGVIVAGAILGVSVLGREAQLVTGTIFAMQVTSGATLLALLLWWGPLAGARHELVDLVTRAGLLPADPKRRSVALLRRVLVLGR